jgi:hypothetical protein
VAAVLGLRVCIPEARRNRDEEASEQGYSAVRAGVLAWVTIKATIAGRRGPRFAPGESNPSPMLSLRRAVALAG